MQHLHIVLENDTVLPQSFGRVWPLTEDQQNVRRSIIFNLFLTFRLSRLGRGAVFSSGTQCHMGRGQTLLSVVFQRTDDHHQQERPPHCEEPLFGLLAWAPQELQWLVPMGRMVQWGSCYVSELVPWSSSSK